MTLLPELAERHGEVDCDRQRGGSTPAVPPFFEGTEKRVEIDFRGDGDLRTIARESWDEVIQLSKTQILNSKTTVDFTSFLLSESSLLVYRTKVVLKTCGGTVPLNAVGRTFELAAGVGMQPEWLSYSRKNFLMPSEQPPEHSSLDSEVALCKKACNGFGDSYILGPMTGDHWLLYDAPFLETDCTKEADFHVDVMMYNLPADVRGHFFTEEPEGSRKGAEDMTKNSGLASIVDGMEAVIDDYCFLHCGYSANIHHRDGSYAMIHVTPQEECSYASFETNLGSARDGMTKEDVSTALNDLIGKVLDVFRPEKFTISLFTDQGAEANIGAAPFQAADERFSRGISTSCHLEQDYVATIVNYRRPSQVNSPGEASRRRDMPRMLQPRG